MITPQIDRDKCDGCGLCIIVCWHRCLVLTDGIVAIVEGADCDWCTQCEAVCDAEAITCPFEIVLA
jgi:MinD superfamily P-loop ATPase